jgi:hypothetical protein
MAALLVVIPQMEWLSVVAGAYVKGKELLHAKESGVRMQPIRSSQMPRFERDRSQAGMFGTVDA